MNSQVLLQLLHGCYSLVVEDGVSGDTSTATLSTPGTVWKGDLKKGDEEVTSSMNWDIGGFEEIVIQRNVPVRTVLAIPTDPEAHGGAWEGEGGRPTIQTNTGRRPAPDIWVWRIHPGLGFVPHVRKRPRLF